MPNRLQRARLTFVLVAVLLGLSAILLVHGDAARAALVTLAAVCLVLAVLFPFITGRLKLGPLEADLREDVADTIVETASREGIDPATLDRIATSAAEAVVKKIPSTSSSPSGRRDVMVCTKCGVLARLEPPPAQSIAKGNLTNILGPYCRACGSLTFKLPE